MFEIEKFRDREKATKPIITIGTEISIRDRELFEIEIISLYKIYIIYKVYAFVACNVPVCKKVPFVRNIRMKIVIFKIFS